MAPRWFQKSRVALYWNVSAYAGAMVFFYKCTLPIAGARAEIILELFFSNVFFKKHDAFFDGVVADSRCRVSDGAPQSRTSPAGLKETDFMAIPFCEYVQVPLDLGRNYYAITVDN